MPNIVVGLLALAFGLWGLSVWWWSVTELLRGLMPLILIAVGFVALAAGISGIQNNKTLKVDKKQDKTTVDDPLDDELNSK